MKNLSQKLKTYLLVKGLKANSTLSSNLRGIYCYISVKNQNFKQRIEFFISKSTRLRFQYIKLNQHNFTDSNISINFSFSKV